MSNRPTYLFGVGATKAGTSWLHRYLAGHPDCHLRAIKELHYFDSLEKGSFAHQVKVNRRRLQAMRQVAAQAGPQAGRAGQAVEDITEWLALIEAGSEDLPGYCRYLEGWRGSRRLVADITPSYADLSVARLRQLVAIAPEVRFVYLLRDPVARAWSHIRMVAGRMPEGQADFAGACAATLDRVLSGAPSEIPARSDYAGALQRLGAAVPADRLLVLFQERLFSAPGLSELCRFLGIRAHAADTTRRVHEGQPLAMTSDQRARLRDWLQPQYDFAARTFPDLPESWRMNFDGVSA